jgi:ABC-type multidrug transport system fused ATPase/permease subunit
MSSLKEFLRLNKSKLVLPVLAALLIFLSSTVNFLLIPKAADNMCAEVKYVDELKNFPYLNESYLVDADPEKVVLGLKKSFEIEKKKAYLFQSLRDKLPVIFFANPFILQAASNLIDPLYPAPCDLAYMGPGIGLWQAQYHSLPSCRFYMSKEQYECMLQGFSENALGYSLAPRSIRDMPYYPASAPEMFLHALFVVLMMYLLSCIVFYLPERYNLHLKIPYLLIIIIILLVVGSVLFNLFSYFRLFFGGLGSLENLSNPEEIRDYDFKIVHCQNTTEYNSTLVKKLRGGRFYVPEGYNHTILGCYKPFCAEICRNISESASANELQGKQPTCVCWWEI